MNRSETPPEVAAFLCGAGYPFSIWQNEDKRLFEALGHYVQSKGWGKLIRDRHLYDWFMEAPRSAESPQDLSRIALAMFYAKPDLQAAFPLPQCASALQHWTHGFLKEMANSQRSRFYMEPGTEGINLIGIHRRECGLSNVLKSVAAALEGVRPVNIVDLDPHLTEADKGATPILDTTSICFLPPSELAKAVVTLDNTFLRARRNICYLAWETERLSPCYKTLLESFDEIWCYSEFNQQAVTELLPGMTTHVTPLYVQPPETAGSGREQFGLSQDDYVIGFHFDHDSSIHRKNPIGLLQAFLRAFPRGAGFEDLVLHVKTHNVEPDAPSLRQLREAMARDTRIRLNTEYWPKEMIYDWLNNLDQYVSLHRAEGFGYGMAEAMVRGVPTMATGYSGNLQFMDEKNSLLVEHELKSIGRGEYFICDEQLWAEPDLDDASEKMRSVYCDTDLKHRLQEAGPRSLIGYLSFENFRSNILSSLGITAVKSSPFD